MMRHVFNRVRRMDGAEIASRLSTAARTAAQRRAFSIRPPHWNRGAIRSVLTRDALTPDVSRAIRLGDWFETSRLLLEGLRGRPGRFLFDHDRMAPLGGAILERWPDAAGDAARRADAMLDGSYDLLGYTGLDYRRDGAIDWHFDPAHGCRAPRGFWSTVPFLNPESGDHKVIWEINRHQHWLAFGRALWLTDDTTYRDAIVGQLSGWLDANPPLDGVNWASMLELAFRGISWTSALHFMLAAEGGRYNFNASDQPWLVDMLIGLDRQLRHVEANLSTYFSPNTHLTGEALSLYVVGLALPELKRSRRWVDTGRRVLLHEIERQIGADGGHVERSTHYHRYTLDFYLTALLMARRCGDSSAEPQFTDAVDRLATFMGAMADDHGQMPAIGDDDGGRLWPLTAQPPRDVRDSLSLAAVLLDKPSLAPWGTTEEAFWLAWTTDAPALLAFEAPPTRVDRQAAVEGTIFADTGYAVVRDADASHLVFDVGAHGYLNGGHAHADALAITLGVGGRPLLVDPGTITYTMNTRLRDRMRSSANHNTLTLDGHGPSVPAGPFHWASRTDAHLDAERRNPRFSWLEASHDGYTALRHRRSILHGNERGWLIVDEVLGRDRHEATLHWHFDPAWTVTGAGRHALRATHRDGAEAWLLHDSGLLELMQADAETGLGWYSPAYGAMTPTSTARIARRGPAPYTMVTWVGTGSAPSLHRVRTRCDPNYRATAVRVTDGDVVTVSLLRSGEPAARETRSCELNDYQTNARVLQYTTAGTELRTIAIADATRLLALHDGLVSIAADQRMPDLHAELAGDVVDLWASEPPSRLQLQGGALTGVRELRLNGRAMPRRITPREDAVIVTSADWPARAPERPRTSATHPAIDTPEARMNTCAA